MTIGIHNSVIKVTHNAFTLNISSYLQEQSWQDAF